VENNGVARIHCDLKCITLMPRKTANLEHVFMSVNGHVEKTMTLWRNATKS
jgi:hypothetical protein